MQSQNQGRGGSSDQTTEIFIPPPPPPPPELKKLPLPALLAGGLFLFATSVAPPQKYFADQLLGLAQRALRSDPTVTMELGMGIEAGGIYASSFATTAATTGSSNTQPSDDGGGDKTRAGACKVEQLVLQFQITGGNAWATGVAYGIRHEQQKEKEEEVVVQLVSLEVANMDAVLNGASFEVPLR